jgi:hypothetical protein
MFLTIMAAVDTWQAEIQAERTYDNIASWQVTHPGDGSPHKGAGTFRRSGESWQAGTPCYHKLGQATYGQNGHEDAKVILDAFNEAGSFGGAAKLLTARKVPTRHKRATWNPSSVARIVRRDKHDREGHMARDEEGRVITDVRKCPYCVPNKRRGMAAKSPRIFTGLLRCGHCGSRLSSMPRRSSVGYFCKVAHNDPRHPRPYVVAEPKVVACVRERLDSWRRLEVVNEQTDDTDRLRMALAKLAQNKDRIVEAFIDGTIDRAERDRRLATLANLRQRVEQEQQIASGKRYLFMRPQVDWTKPPDEINTAIRSIWSSIVMNGTMLPKRAVWVPTGEYGEEGPE